MFAKTFGCVRFIYNRMLAEKIKHYEETKQKLNNTPAQYKNEFDWLKEVDSLALANAQMNLQTAFTLSLTIVATNELHDFNHVLGCNYEKDLHL